MKNKICILMPLYPPHFMRANVFINSFFTHKLERQCDLAFIFSNEAEKMEFEKLCGKAYYKALILPEILLKNSGSAIVNVKKLYGLNALYKDYEFVIIYDAETLIIKNINLLKMCKDFLKEKSIFANKTLSNFADIHNASAKFFSSHKDFYKLNTPLYAWYNQPCIYPSKFLGHFFEVTKINENLYQELTWFSFDYMIFAYYLVLYRGFELKDIGVISTWGFLEHSDFKALNFNFLSLNFYHTHIALYPLLRKDKIFALIHLDRNPSLNAEVLANATQRIQASLSYKLGSLMVQTKKFKDFLILPFSLIKLAIKHKERQKSYKNFIKHNPNLTLPHLENCPDYKEVLKLKNHLSFKLGQALIKASNNAWGGGYLKFIFWDVPRIKKEFKAQKDLKQGSENERI